VTFLFVLGLFNVFELSNKQLVVKFYHIQCGIVTETYSGGSRGRRPTGAAAQGTKEGGHQREEWRAKITGICITKNVGAQSGNLAQGTRNHRSASGLSLFHFTVELSTYRTKDYIIT